MRSPSLLALDFDGVICDGLFEYFQTAWRAYCQLWNPDKTPPTEEVAQTFYRLRPVVETGWEMPVLIHALESGFSEAVILQEWPNLALELLHHHRLNPKEVGAIVDRIRDQWIAQDLPSWLSEHRFYPGVIDRLKATENFVIISTKEARFIRQLLQEQGVEIQDDRLFGKEKQRPKYEILRQLKPHYGTIWFIEDRLKTLQMIEKHPELTDVELFLADWGYNLLRDRDIAQQSDRLHLLSLDQFQRSFDLWS
ncbi:MAG: haloacid dehalogenase [Alkalinema sp. CACIAM 70d]|nr:MAG: haloacid dehalogenase [Alkalinema sp. CACIAM 70d]